MGKKNTKEQTRTLSLPPKNKPIVNEALDIAGQQNGRISPAITISAVPVNDSVELEKEADQMGKKALKNL